MHTTQAYERTGVTERVANGARWLDENFPGWKDRIDTTTLKLNDGEHCICGQLFEANARDDETISGFAWAYDHLFAQANSWITALVHKGADYRAGHVSEALGFMAGNQYDEAGTFVGIITFGDLQEAWEKYLSTN